MSRQSSNQYDNTGSLINGYDYTEQCWVLNRTIVTGPNTGKPTTCKGKPIDQVITELMQKDDGRPLTQQLIRSLIGDKKCGRIWV